MNKNELIMLQSLPIDIKIMKTKRKLSLAGEEKTILFLENFTRCAQRCLRDRKHKQGE